MPILYLLNMGLIIIDKELEKELTIEDENQKSKNEVLTLPDISSKHKPKIFEIWNTAKNYLVHLKKIVFLKKPFVMFCNEIGIARILYFFN